MFHLNPVDVSECEQVIETNHQHLEDDFIFFICVSREKGSNALEHKNNLNAAKSPHPALEAVVKQVVDSNLELYVFFGIDVFVDILTMAWKMLSSSRCMWKSLTVSRGTTMISRTLNNIFLLDGDRMISR